METADDTSGLAKDTYYNVLVTGEKTIQLRKVSDLSIVTISSAADWAGGASSLVTTTTGIFKYTGPNGGGSVSLADSVQQYTINPDKWMWVDANDLSTQDYGDVSLWKQIVDPSTTEVKAYLADTSVDAGGALTVAASTASSIDAIVIAVAAAVGGGVGVGIGASGAGSYGSNKIATNVDAYIDGSGATGVSASSVTVGADDFSGINAITGGIAVAGAIGVAGGRGGRGALRARNTDDPRTTRLSANGRRGGPRATPAVLRGGPQPRHVRDGNPTRIAPLACEPDVRLSHGAGPRGRRARHGLFARRPRARDAVVVFSVEQHSGRRTARACRFWNLARARRARA
jgi:hypothetical protein